MQYSRSALTKTEYWSRITSLDLLAMFHLMQPRTRLAFWAVGTHCWLMFSWLNRYPKVLFGRVVLKSLIPQLMLIIGAAMTQVKDL